MPKSTDTILTVAPFGRKFGFPFLFNYNHDTARALPRSAPATLASQAQANYTILSQASAYRTSTSPPPNPASFDFALNGQDIVSLATRIDTLNETTFTGSYPNQSQLLLPGHNTFEIDTNATLNNILNWAALAFPNIHGGNVAGIARESPGGFPSVPPYRSLEITVPRTGRYIILFWPRVYLSGGAVFDSSTDMYLDGTYAGRARFYHNRGPNVVQSTVPGLTARTLTAGTHTLEWRPLTAFLNIYEASYLLLYDPLEQMRIAGGDGAGTPLSSGPGVINLPVYQEWAFVAWTDAYATTAGNKIGFWVHSGVPGTTPYAQHVFDVINVRTVMGVAVSTLGPISGNVTFYFAPSSGGLVVDGFNFYTALFMPRYQFINF